MAAEKIALQPNHGAGLLEAVWREQMLLRPVSEPGTETPLGSGGGDSKGLLDLRAWWPTASREQFATDDDSTSHIRVIDGPRCDTCSAAPSLTVHTNDSTTTIEPKTSWESHPREVERLRRAMAVQSVNAKRREFETRRVVDEEEWDEESVVVRSYEEIIRPGL